jgi:hypothetical protein
MNPEKKSPDAFVGLDDEAGVVEVLKTSVFGLWQVVNNLTRLRPSRRERYTVAIFGSARVDPGHRVYQAVREASAEITRMGCDIVTGGGPGLMQAANEGAADAGAARSVGIRIELPFEQAVNAFVGEAYEHGTFFTRLHHFTLSSDAFIAVRSRMIRFLILAAAAVRVLSVWRAFLPPLREWKGCSELT